MRGSQREFPNTTSEKYGVGNRIKRNDSEARTNRLRKLPMNLRTSRPNRNRTQSRAVIVFVLTLITIVGCGLGFISFSLLKKAATDDKAKWVSDLTLSLSTSCFTAVPIFVIFEIIVNGYRKREERLKEEMRTERNRLLQSLKYDTLAHLEVASAYIRDFATKLQHPENLPSKYLATLLSEDEKRDLVAIHADKEWANKLQSLLNSFLARAVSSKDLIGQLKEAARRSETKDLLGKRNRSEKEELHLRFLLLEDSFYQIHRDKATRQNILDQLNSDGLLIDTGKIYMEGVDLSYLDLKGATFEGIELREARLIGAEATHCNFSGAMLAESDMTGAKLYGAKLFKTSFRGANMSKADLTRSDMTGSVLIDAILHGAIFFEASVKNVQCVPGNGESLREPKADKHTQLVNGLYWTDNDGAFSEQLRKKKAQ